MGPDDLCYAKALLASPARAEALFQDGLGTIAQNWPFLRGRLLLAYGEWLRRQRRVMDARAPLRTARDILDAPGAVPGAIGHGGNCAPQAKPAVLRRGSCSTR